ncbi:MAG: hypothetical protein IPI67_02080 [Myxococcales bacterium]|nr:hypothetical protein [Myxococcales bacterium]
MTSASASLSVPEALAPPVPPASRGAALIEFLLVGGATLVLFPLLWLLRRSVGLDSAELAVGFVAFHAGYVINDPHFSVTYLLFYRDFKRRAFGGAFGPGQRIRYLLSALVVPLVLLVWALLGLWTHSATALGSLVQLMFLLVGWHYVKQAFGVLAVLSARRGVRFSPRERLAFLVHCFAGWAYAWSSPFDPGREVEEKGVVYTTLGHPHGLELATGVAFALSTVGVVWVLAGKWRAERRLPPLAPLAGFLITIWIWTVYSSVDPLMVYVIPGLHSVQYLYFVWLLRRNQARAAEGPPHFGRPAAVQIGLLAVSALGLGWLLLRGAPTLLDSLLIGTPRSPAAQTDLGPTPYFATFFAFVNIHHYFMDHVIWRRENPETQHLRA